MKELGEIRLAFSRLMTLHEEISEQFMWDPSASAPVQERLFKAEEAFSKVGQRLKRCDTLVEKRGFSGIEDGFLLFRETDVLCHAAQEMLEDAARTDERLDKICRAQWERIGLLRKELAELDVFLVKVKTDYERYLDLRRALEETDG